MVTYVNGNNVFYHFKHKHRVIEDAYICRSEITSMKIHSPGVTVPAEAADAATADQVINFTEHDGIIYAANIERPPSYPGGINVLYSLLENTVLVTRKDMQIYGDAIVTVLYQLVIQDDGKIYGAGIKESCIQNYGLNNQAALLEKEIMKKICMAGSWEPGIIQGENANMNIYLPVKFEVDKRRIVIYPSEYMYLFKHRGQ
jgi:hypothetical protein